MRTTHYPWTSNGGISSPVPGFPRRQHTHVYIYIKLFLVVRKGGEERGVALNLGLEAMSSRGRYKWVGGIRGCVDCKTATSECIAYRIPLLPEALKDRVSTLAHSEILYLGKRYYSRLEQQESYWTE